MQSIQSLYDLDVKGKKVLLRVDFNVPLNDQGEITDDQRIRASLPTIRYILERGGSVILMSHLGRPKGVDPKLSLAPCAKHLSEILNKPVKLIEAYEEAKNIKSGDVVLLENLRFHPGEKKPEEDPGFLKLLASLGDCYVNDAFGAAHRKHTSTYFLATAFKGKSAAGLLMIQELEHLSRLLENPDRPFWAVIGGAKVSSKIGVLSQLLEKVDGLIIGGAMAHTFLKAQGVKVGSSLVEEEWVKPASEILGKCQKMGVDLLLPIDEVGVKTIEKGAESKIFELKTSGISEGWQGVDIGPKTIANFENHLKKAKTVLWNGPLGVFEIADFAKGTQAIAAILAKLNATTIVGGGDSVAALNRFGLTDRMTHVSTGGGATLEFIEKGSLPGVEILLNLQK